MLGILRKQRDRDQIPRFLPKLLSGTKFEVANKTGALDAVRNDVGVVSTPNGRYVLSIFCRDSKDRQWTPDNEATLTSARLAEALMRELLPPRS